MSAKVRRFLGLAGQAWCHVMHPDAMWPMSGYYRCRQCHRKYRVPWEPGKDEAESHQSGAFALELSPAFKAIAAAVLFILAVPAFAGTMQGSWIDQTPGVMTGCDPMPGVEPAATCR